MPPIKTTAKSPGVARNNQSPMSPMRQFITNLDGQDVVQSTMGNGLITASPMMTRSNQNTSATRIGVRSSHKRHDLNKQCMGFNSGYLPTQANKENPRTPSKQQDI